MKSLFVDRKCSQVHWSAPLVPINLAQGLFIEDHRIITTSVIRHLIDNLHLWWYGALHVGMRVILRTYKSYLHWFQKRIVINQMNQTNLFTKKYVWIENFLFWKLVNNTHFDRSICRLVAEGLKNTTDSNH